MTQAYPLYWPLGYPRTTAPTKSRFSTSINAAVGNVHDELRMFGNDTGKFVSDIVISSNCSLGNVRPDDAGVAVYFRWDNIDACIAVDRYKFPEDNLQAIAKVVEAERTKMRHGGLNVVRSSFRGYAALPPPRDASGQLAPPWRSVLFGKPEIRCTKEEAEEAYRHAAKKHHPDRGGDVSEFNKATDAIRQAREEFGA